MLVKGCAVRKLIPHVAALLVILGCIALSRWQIDRAEEKTLLLAREATRAELQLEMLQPPFDLPQPITARGRWLGDHQVLLDNRIREHQPGVFVLTPFALTDGRVFMVNRGWAAWPARNATLPDPAPPTPDELAIHGVLTTPPGVGARIGQADADDTSGWPRLQAWFDPTPVAIELGTMIPEAVIRLAPDDPAHLTGDAWQVVTFGPERHRGYALTWASIAFVVGLIWLSLSVRQFRAGRRPDQENR